jgi:hypothetical protein
MIPCRYRPCETCWTILIMNCTISAKIWSDHPPRLNAGELDLLKETIAPGSSASCQSAKLTPREARQDKSDSQEVHKPQKPQKPQKTRSRKCRAISEDTVGDRHLPELPGSDLGPSPARMQQSIRKVEAWFRRCEEANEQGNQRDEQLSIWRQQRQ